MHITSQGPIGGFGPHFFGIQLFSRHFYPWKNTHQTTLLDSEMSSTFVAFIFYFVRKLSKLCFDLAALPEFSLKKTPATYSYSKWLKITKESHISKKTCKLEFYLNFCAKNFFFNLIHRPYFYQFLD